VVLFFIFLIPIVTSKDNRDYSATGGLHCARCGAELPAGAAVCWLCNAPVGATSDSNRLAPVRLTPARESALTQPGGGFSLASLMMFVTLVCVVLGVFTIAPGLGVPLSVVAFVTWLRTVSVVKWRASTGTSLSSAEIILIFVRSVAFTLLILVLVGVAAVAAFAAACFGVINAAEPGPEITGLLVVSVVVLVAAIFGLIAASRSERRRWRRDHHEPK
jgi:hypothetical protein